MCHVSSPGNLYFIGSINQTTVRPLRVKLKDIVAYSRKLSEFNPVTQTYQLSWNFGKKYIEANLSTTNIL